MKGSLKLIYIIFDNPEDYEKMQFLKNEDYSTSFFIQKFPKDKCNTIKKMVAFCLKSIKETKKNDTLIFWYDFMGIICQHLCRLAGKKRKIICLNLLLKNKNTVKNKIAQLIYKTALNSNNIAATVVSDEYGIKINKLLNINMKYNVLRDIYHKEYETKKSKTIIKSSVFCGGRNGRDWNFFFELAYNMPNIQFNCVMSECDYNKFKNIFTNNVYAKKEISEQEFLELMNESNIVIMPLNTQAPAGLIALFQAAANNKRIIASNTIATRAYLGNNCAILCNNSLQEWQTEIKKCITNDDYATNKTIKLKNFLENKCSEEHYAKTLFYISQNSFI